MFADDLLLFGEATEAQMARVVRILNTFCRLPGQEVIQEKTNLMFSKNASRNMQNKLAHLSRYRVTNNLGKYLGVPLNGKRLQKNDFQYLVDQIATKLTNWKKNSLSFVGRITLPKSVLEAMLIY